MTLVVSHQMPCSCNTIIGDVQGPSTVRPDLHRSSGPFERTDSASDLPVNAATGRGKEIQPVFVSLTNYLIDPTPSDSNYTWRFEADKVYQGQTLDEPALLEPDLTEPCCCVVCI